MVPEGRLVTHQMNSSFIGTKMYDIVPTEIENLNNDKFVKARSKWVNENSDVI